MAHIPNKIKVMVFGTFDMIHPGHRDFFRQAKDLAKDVELVVSIARDVNVERIKNHPPVNNELFRLQVAADEPLVDRAILGSIENYMEHIIAEKPDIIALGYDQVAYTENLLADLKVAQLKANIVRLKSFQPQKYKTSLLR